MRSYAGTRRAQTPRTRALPSLAAPTARQPQSTSRYSQPGPNADPALAPTLDARLTWAADWERLKRRTRKDEGRDLAPVERAVVLSLERSPLRGLARKGCGGCVAWRLSARFAFVALFAAVFTSPQTRTSDASVAARARAPVGALHQLRGPSGCVVEDEEGSSCVASHAMDEPSGLAVSPDGRNVYVSTHASRSVVVLDRGAAGRLSQPEGARGCVSAGGDDAGCALGRGLGSSIRDQTRVEGSEDVAVSPDGRSVYVASGELGSASLGVFARDAASGELTQLAGPDGCVAADGSAGCATAAGMRFDRETPRQARPESASRLAFSPRGDYLYMTTGWSLVIFTRDPGTGALTPLGCIATGRPECARARRMRFASDLSVSPDGRFVYVVSGGVLITLRRTATGMLAQLRARRGCIADVHLARCAFSNRLGYVWDVTMSVDGRMLYLSTGDTALTLLRRNRRTRRYAGSEVAFTSTLATRQSRAAGGRTWSSSSKRSRCRPTVATSTPTTPTSANWPQNGSCPTARFATSEPTSDASHSTRTTALRPTTSATRAQWP